MVGGFEVSIRQQGKNPRLFQVGGIGERSTFEEFAEDIKETLIETSLQVLKQEQSEGFEKKPRTRIDNKFGKDLFDVNPFGKVEFFAREDVSKVLRGIYEAIEKRSPSVTGQYKSGNYVFRNTQLVARSRSELESFIKAREQLGFNDKDVYRFINVNPYGRKLERYGVSKGRQRPRIGKSKAKKPKRQFISVPNGAYSLAARSIRSKFKGAASQMKFLFHKNGAKGISIQSTGNFRNTYKKTAQPYLYPMIIFAFSSEGTK
jgi:hypothetical protein